MMNRLMPMIGAFTLSIFFTVELTAQTIHVSLRGKPQPVEGKPIHWDGGLVALMGRDGQLFTFHPNEAEQFRQTSPYFQSFSQAAMRGELLREFGRAFDVSGTGQYLVVHPAGQRDQWAQRFEELFRSMHVYFGARGFPWQSPKFPFIAIVFPTQQQYLSYARKQGRSIGGSALGYYDPVTNRIYMYDVTGNRPNSADWHTNAETIIHEAAHQTAFNVGIHNRFAETPRWIVEGLGTLFEARGIWNSRHFPNRSDRVNVAQLQYYLRAVTQPKSLEMLKLQVATDDVFRRSASLAYAHAWALSFFLSEQHPRDYSRYLSMVNRRKNFEEYSPRQRLRDFQSVFGQDLALVNARMQRFIGALASSR